MSLALPEHRPDQTQQEDPEMPKNWLEKHWRKVATFGAAAVIAAVTPFVGGRATPGGDRGPAPQEPVAEAPADPSNPDNNLAPIPEMIDEDSGPNFSAPPYGDFDPATLDLPTGEEIIASLPEDLRPEAISAAEDPGEHIRKAFSYDGIKTPEALAEKLRLNLIALDYIGSDLGSYQKYKDAGFDTAVHKRIFEEQVIPAWMATYNMPANATGRDDAMDRLRAHIGVAMDRNQANIEFGGNIPQSVWDVTIVPGTMSVSSGKVSFNVFRRSGYDFDGINDVMDTIPEGYLDKEAAYYEKITVKNPNGFPVGQEPGNPTVRIDLSNPRDATKQQLGKAA